MKQDKLFGILAKHAHTAICILLDVFSQFDEQLQNDIFDFIIQQTLVDFTNHNSCAKLASSIVAVNSRLWLYRFLHSNSFFQDVLQLFNRLLTIESIPVVEQVYQAILADVTSNLNILLNFLEQKTIAIGSGSVSTSDLTEDDAEAQHLFLMMYVLTRPLFEFLAKHLQLTNSKLARQYPSVHYGVVKTLYSHCAALLQSNETSIHDSYYAILCCLPVNILTSKLSTHGTLLSSKNDYSDFASIAKQNHMNSPYLETFTTHCLNLILGNNESSKDEHLSEGQYRLLSYEQLQNVGNNTLIWFWAIWECAQFCVMNNLKTSLGKPQETFLALEEQTNHSSTSSSSGEVNVSTDKDDWWCDLHRCRLLLQLIEALEKRMYHPYEAAALSLPQLPKNREVLLLPDRKFAPAQHSVRQLNSILPYSQPSFNNQSASATINSNWTALRMGAARLACQQNSFTLASKLLIRQFQSTHAWSTGPPTPQSSNTSLGSPLPNNMNITIAIKFLSRSILPHLINESQPNSQHNNQRSLNNYTSYGMPKKETFS
ncbi:unnamed protein product [Rotaria magnacalcarata]|uniref:Uncharacterized protein n=1 Tax=Rotaria magnacalcarata TaxID=392030 RepID=A0A816YJN1_9BILA|nr:unnamed protein product [Rotaria magnacalcarata]